MESSADIDFAEIDKSNIVILIRTGEKGFLLDWDAGSFVLLNQASFGHDVGVSALADLQYQVRNIATFFAKLLIHPTPTSRYL